MNGSLSNANPLDGIIYKIAHRSDYESIVGLLYSDFFTDEPMSNCLKLSDGKTRSSVIDDFVYEALEENLTILALDENTKRLLGCCINVLAHKTNYNEISLEEYIQSYQKSPFRHIMHVLYNVNKDANEIYDQLGSNVLFDIKILATDKNNRRGGLGTDLLKRSVALGKCLGFKGAKTEATGIYSRKAFTKLGFGVASECFYDSFVSAEKEENIFSGAVDPHRCTTLMTMKL